MNAHVFLAPSPRTVAEIFTASDLARLRACSTLHVHEGAHVSDAVFDEQLALATVILGQTDLPTERLQRCRNLRAIINVESNFLPNIDYDWCFAHQVRVLTVSPVFAEPVAEIALGMAIDLARGVSRADRAVRAGTERYGLAANAAAWSLRKQTVGFIGMGELGRAIVPLLAPFQCRLLAYDPWLPAEYIASLGCEAVPLLELLARSRCVFVVAGVTAENQGFLDAAHFAAMQPGAALLLLSRAGVVDFEALMDAAERGHIRVATDVYPEEPIPAGHRVRTLDGMLLSPHMAGGMDSALKEIGTRAVADCELILRGLPPVMCRAASPETVARLRSKPIALS